MNDVDFICLKKKRNLLAFDLAYDEIPVWLNYQSNPLTNYVENILDNRCKNRCSMQKKVNEY